MFNEEGSRLTQQSFMKEKLYRVNAGITMELFILSS